MSENYNKNSNCGYGEQLVSYLYEEIEPRERDVFEKHLRDCQHCPPEIADFQEMRFAFGDWREADAVQTPRFVAVNQTNPQTPETKADWLDRLRSFVFSPARSFAVAAVVLIALCGGLYFLTIQPSLNQRLSDKISQPAENEPESVIAEVPTDSDSPKSGGTILNSPDTALNSSDAAASPTVNNRGSNAAPAAKVASRASKPASKSKPEIRPNGSQAAKNERPSNDNKKVPRIITADEEDRSLRLADIFDEVSMK